MRSATPFSEKAPSATDWPVITTMRWRFLTPPFVAWRSSAK